MLELEGKHQKDVEIAHLVNVLRTTRAQHSRENIQSTLCRRRQTKRRLDESQLNLEEREHLFQFLCGNT